MSEHWGWVIVVAVMCDVWDPIVMEGCDHRPPSCYLAEHDDIGGRECSQVSQSSLLSGIVPGQASTGFEAAIYQTANCCHKVAPDVGPSLRQMGTRLLTMPIIPTCENLQLRSPSAIIANT